MTESEHQGKDDRHWQDAQPIRRLLDDSQRDLPDPIQTGLRQARQAAVQASASRRHTAWRSTTPWYGLAASIALAVTLGLLWPEQDAQDMAEEDVLYAMAELEEADWAVVQDLEFVYWLSEQPHEALDDTKRSADRPG